MNSFSVRDDVKLTGGIDMLELLFNAYSKHRYSLAATGLKTRDYEFSTRQAAEKTMYDIMKKNGLHIEEVWDDHHFKTYLCNNGVRFYINRI